MELPLYNIQCCYKRTAKQNKTQSRNEIRDCQLYTELLYSSAFITRTDCIKQSVSHLSIVQLSFYNSTHLSYSFFNIVIITLATGTAVFYLLDVVSYNYPTMCFFLWTVIYIPFSMCGSGGVSLQMEARRK